MLSRKQFEERAQELENNLHFARGWRWNFKGAAYSTRLIALREYLQEIIKKIDKFLADDGALDEFGLAEKERKLAEDIVNGSLS